MFKFDPRDLELITASSVGPWSSANLTSWKSYYDFSNLKLDQTARVRRSDVICARDELKTETLPLVMLIFAWGGMNRLHARLFLDAPRTWLATAEGLHSGSLSKIAGYQAFHELSNSGKMPGCGPAYYTKLLTFLPKRGAARGIIMDQWTSRSVNLLANEEIVKTVKARNNKQYVHKANDSSVYGRFCAIVEDLTEIIHGNRDEANVEDIEMRLFSNSKLRWRQYVLAKTCSLENATL